MVSEAIAGRDFTVVVGKEDHVILISRDIAAQLRAELMIAEPQQPELGEEGEHRRRSRQVLRR